MLLVVQFGRVVSFPRRTVVEEMRGDAESSTQAESETMEELGKTNGGDESEAAMTQAVAIWSRFSNWMDTLASFYSTGAVHVVCMRYADKSSVAIPGDQHHGSILVDMQGGGSLVSNCIGFIRGWDPRRIRCMGPATTER